MATKDDVTKRKEIKDMLRKKQKETFDDNLPMSRDMFEALFEYLDYMGQHTTCDHTFRLTLQFLEENNIPNVDAVLDWLESYHGHCDCEIPADVEELFDNQLLDS